MRTLSKSQEIIILQHEKITYYLIYSSRRSLSIEIHNGELFVRSPYAFPLKKIELFLIQKQNWILQKLQDSRHKKMQLENQKANCLFSDAQKKSLEERYRELARDYITQRVNYYIAQTGDYYNNLAIRSQKTRWGSCSSKKTLSFNWRLILAPPIILDYVVVHEICHLKYMNHSHLFWDRVFAIMPDYKTRRKWLKDHGTELAESFTPIPFSNI